MAVSVKKDTLRKFAHDLRSPVSVMRGYVEFKSADDTMGEDDVAYLEALRLSADKIEKIAGLIDDCVPCATPVDRPIQRVAEPVRFETGQSILIVDDDVSLRMQWRLFFKNKSIPTIEVASGEELINRKLDYKNIRQAIVDYNFEGSSLNGFDVIEFLQQKGVSKIHLCTGQHAEEELQCKLRSFGTVSLIPKPIDRKICENIFAL